MKIFKFKSSFMIKDLASKPMRDGINLNKLLIKTIESILNGTSKTIDNEHDEYDICIYVDKMSRIFYYLENKIYSVCFPFFISKSKENNIDSSFYEDTVIIEELNSCIVIDLNVVTLLNYLYEDISVFEKGLEDIYFELEEKLKSAYKDLSLSYYAYPIDDMWILISNLMNNELGYLRYDYDEEHCDGKKHPLEHIDFYFSDRNTFKIGLLEYIDIVDILDNNKERFYLHKNN